MARHMMQHGLSAAASRSYYAGANSFFGGFYWYAYFTPLTRTGCKE